MRYYTEISPPTMTKTGIKKFVPPKQITWLLFLVLSGYLITYTVYFAAWPIDDSFIAMRVARNFLLYGKPYFNIDDPVLGTSCHTWILLLSAGFSLFGAKVFVVLAFELFILLALFYFSAQLLREKFGANGSLLAAFVAIHFSALPFAALLRETPLALLFFCLAIFSTRRKSFFYAGFFSALAVFTRNEFVLFSLLLSYFFRNKPKFWLGQGLIALPLLIFLFHYYQTIFPQPLFAKAIYSSVPPLEKAVEMIVPELQVRFETGFGRFFFLPVESFPSRLFDLTAPALLVILACLILHRRKTTDPINASIAAFPLLLSACYLRNTAWIPIWYWPHVVFPLFLWGLLNYRRGTWLPIAYIAVCAGHLPQLGNDLYSLATSQAKKHSFALITSRTPSYLEIGKSLETFASDCKSVYATEIGALGWNFPGAIIDGLGLVSSDTFAMLLTLKPNRAITLNINTLLPLLRNNPPCLIVSLPHFIVHQENQEELQSLLHQKYRILSKSPLVFTTYGNKDILVWERLTPALP
ncbi:MAG: hypothetical protein ACXWQO_14830 [Bdellovibrionota bacterium]